MQKSTLWDRSTTEWLINLYHQQPCLWDVNVIEYRDKQTRENAMEFIAQELKIDLINITIDDVRNRISSIRAQWRKQMRQLEAGKRSGSGKIKGPTLWCFDLLQFLVKIRNSNIVKDKRMHRSLPLDIESRCNYSLSPSPEDKFYIDSSEFLAVKSEEILSEYDTDDSSSLLKPLVPKVSIDKESTKPIKTTMKRRYSEEFCDELSVSEMDHDQIFGNYVASALKNLSSQNHKMKLRKIIQTAILDIEDQDAKESSKGGDENAVSSSRTSFI